MISDGMSTRQNLVNVISICKSDKSKASVSLLGCSWILGNISILQLLWHLKTRPFQDTWKAVSGKLDQMQDNIYQSLLVVAG